MQKAPRVAIGTDRETAEMKKVDMASAEMIHVGTPIYGPVERMAQAQVLSEVWAQAA